MFDFCVCKKATVIVLFSGNFKSRCNGARKVALDCFEGLSQINS